MTITTTVNNVFRTVAIATVALGILAALLASLGPLGNAVAAAKTDGHRVEDVVFWEENTNLSGGETDGVARPAMSEQRLSAEEIHFLEMNLYLPDGEAANAQPASSNQILTADEIRFLEMNVWELEGQAAPAGAGALIPPAFTFGEPS